MLLAIDVGNSNTVLGLYSVAEPSRTQTPVVHYNTELAAQWRITT